MNLDTLMALTMNTVLAIEATHRDKDSREKKQLALEAMMRMTNRLSSQTGMAQDTEAIRRYAPIAIDTTVEVLNDVGIFRDHDRVETAETAEATKIIHDEDERTDHDLALRRARGEKVEETTIDEATGKKIRPGTKKRKAS